MHLNLQKGITCIFNFGPCRGYLSCCSLGDSLKYRIRSGCINVDLFLKLVVLIPMDNILLIHTKKAIVIYIGMFSVCVNVLT